jgi:DNA-binding transcriptional LysR family regulator
MRACRWPFQFGNRLTNISCSTAAGTMLGACLAGTGIARFKASGVLDLLEKGRLIELLADWAGEIYSLYALYPSRHLPAAKVRAFIDFVIEFLDAERA